MNTRFKLRTIALVAIATVALLYSPPVAQAQGPVTVDLSQGQEDVRLLGTVAGDVAGNALAAGDVNGDGIPDLVVGAFSADRGPHTDAGEVYILFGRSSYAPTIELDEVDVCITGEGNSLFGKALAIGDVNGDGLNDVVVGAPKDDPAGRSDAGGVYVFYGRPCWPGSLDTSDADVRVQGASAGDLAGISLATGDLNGDGLADILVGADGADPGGRSKAGAVYVIGGSAHLPSVMDLAAGVAMMEVHGAQADDCLGRGEGVAAGDLNGDGVADLIASARLADPLGRVDAGAAYVVYGGTALPALLDLSTTAADVTVYGESSGDHFGYGLAAGDLNGDGVDDLVGGAPGDAPNGLGDEGAVYVLYGGSLTETEDLAAGAADLAVYGAHGDDLLGPSVAVADVNGDGVDDLIAGAPGRSGIGAGAVFVCFGGELPSVIDLQGTSANLTVLGGAAGDNAGLTVCAADLNGDGMADLVAGALHADPGGRIDAGAAYVIFGRRQMDLSSQPSDATVTGTGNGELGRWLAAGDFNGDGVEDMLIAAPRDDPEGLTNAGAAYVLYGGNDFTGTISSAEADVSLWGIMADDGAGEGVAAGDLNGDGIQDIIIGALLADPAGRADAGETYVVYGGVSLSGAMELADANVRVQGAYDGDRLGRAVAAADVNGDGIDDLIVGAPNASRPELTYAGEVYVFYGGALPNSIDLCSTAADVTLCGSLGEQAGFSLATGDVNGDGIADLVVGAPEASPKYWYHEPRCHAGKVYVVYGSSSLPALIHLDPDFDVMIQGVTAGDELGYDVAAGDVNGDGIDDLVIGAPLADVEGRTHAGTAYVVHGGDLSGVIDPWAGGVDCPSWREYYHDVWVPSVALDSQGWPVVAWTEEDYYATSFEGVYLKRWNGAKWEELGGSASGEGLRGGYGPVVQVDASGNPVVACESLGVTRWTGAAWVRLGDLYFTRSGVGLVLDEDDSPVVAWDDSGVVRVSHWDGSSWQEFAGSPIGECAPGAGYPDVAVDSRGRFVVTWIGPWVGEDNHGIYLKRWTGTEWEELAGSASGTGIGVGTGHDSGCGQPAVATDSCDRIVIAWISGDWGAYLKRWTGTQWEELGGSASGEGIGNWALSLDVAVDVAGNPAVVWNDLQYMYFSRWNGSTWEGLGASDTVPLVESLVQEKGGGSLAFNAEGYPVIVGAGERGGEQPILKRWNGATWAGVSIAVAVHGHSAQGLLGHSVAARDINGDGFDDLLLGAPKVNPGNRSYAGEVYTIFGAPSLPVGFDLATQRAAVTLYGEAADDRAGVDLAAGDTDDDGVSDMLVGASNAGGHPGKAHILRQALAPKAVRTRFVPSGDANPVTFESTGLTLDFASGSAGPVTVTLVRNAPPNPPSRLTAKAWWAITTTKAAFNATATFHYADRAVAGLNEDTLWLVGRSGTGASWAPVANQTVDAASNVVTVTGITGFSEYTLVTGRRVQNLRTGTWYATIQTAVDAAVPGDTVQAIADIFRERVTMRAGVNIVGAGAGQSVIDAAGLGRSAVEASGGDIGRATTLSGFTIQGGDSYSGGGVWIRNGASPTIRDNRIWHNSAHGGGGMFIQGRGQPLIVNNAIEDNTSSVDGGGVYITGGARPSLDRNTIARNFANRDGGGVFAWDQGGAFLTNNVIHNNRATHWGDGLYMVNDAGLTVINNTIADNDGHGIYRVDGPMPTVVNNILWGNGDDLVNVQSRYCDVEDGDGGEGNISSDPLFVNALGDDYRLQSGSPANNAGTGAGAPRWDKDGTPRPKGDGVDMGAYEFGPEVEVSIGPDDLWTDPLTLRQGSQAAAGANVHNGGGQTITGVEVRFYLGDPEDGGVEIGSGPYTTAAISPGGAGAAWTGYVWDTSSLEPGDYQLYAVLDPDDVLAEGDEANNVAHRTVTILPPAVDTEPPTGTLIINDDAPITASRGVTLTLSAQDNDKVLGMYIVEFEYSHAVDQWLPVISSDWQLYRITEPWAFYSDRPGVKYISAWFSDVARNISSERGHDTIDYTPSGIAIGEGEVHVYRPDFAISAPVTVVLTNAAGSGDADLFVWQPGGSGMPDYYSMESGTTTDRVTFTAPISGTYQIEVHGVEATSYTLSTQVEASEGVQHPRAAPDPMMDKMLPPAPYIPTESVPPTQIVLPVAVPPSALRLPLIVKSAGG